MNIRNGRISDVDELTAIEAECFPAAEAAERKSFEDRLKHYADHFWILEDDNGKIISFVNGMVTDEEHLTDKMYENASMHNENGAWQMIFGVNTLPKYRKNGYAEAVLRNVISDAKEQSRKGLVLTCKEKLIHFYGKLGFVDEGVSDSEHGGVVWHEMRLTF
ncbi:GNAT family N-acetyltransferase [Anaerotignum sp. MSJ-24]|uniref:GNAT family N-acetyltransferase n=1 Tax=Anaerotignum sp. MSJ-24 TaxID=2841521 RepID=UPI001C109A9E|nr:GNAT family N-acetyltransferase [Anaerotignum sp. MSJ-24]MBD9219032.1 GNAT family N-acetyltransferase [Clostridiales bacterium]MBU5463441.1 GNAT family N-acetyltransferase [Anaerotignum sp. MSJ-24]